MATKTYTDLLHELHNPNDEQPNPNYYHLLITHSRLILQEIAIRNQGQVAKDLNMSGSKLSNIVSVLKEYAND